MLFKVVPYWFPNAVIRCVPYILVLKLLQMNPMLPSVSESASGQPVPVPLPDTMRQKNKMTAQTEIIRSVEIFFFFFIPNPHFRANFFIIAICFCSQTNSRTKRSLTDLFLSSPFASLFYILNCHDLSFSYAVRALQIHCKDSAVTVFSGAVNCH